MQTKVKIKQRDSSGYKVRQISIAEQMRIDELCEGFLKLSLDKQQMILDLINVIE